MTDRDLAFTPAWQLRQLLDSKKVSPVELTELCLRRIEELNPRLNAFLTVVAEEALAEARTAEQRISQGQKGGPFLGIPVGIKDMEITKGVRSTIGSLVFKDLVPDRDSAGVERVRKAGGIVIGKTNTSEFGLSGTTENRLGDDCRNPWNPEHTSGGSSGGSAAAVAAGLCPIALGSDGGGSIRIPSSFCGLYGIKPAQGRVPLEGGPGKGAPNLIAGSGPLASNVRDAALLLQAISGYDSRDIVSSRESPPDFVGALGQGVKGLRIAWSPDLGYAAVDPEVAQVCSMAARVFEELGCSVEAPAVSLDYPMGFFIDIFSTNSYNSYSHLLKEHGGLLTDYARESLEHGSQVTGSSYADAMLSVQVMQAKVGDLMASYDLLLTPTMAVAAFPVGQFPKVIGGREVLPRWDYTPFTPVFNLTGLPAASIPCGFSAEGMPIGLHIIGRQGDEPTVLRASAAFEEARPWAHSKPQVS